MNAGMLGLAPGLFRGSPFDPYLWEDAYSCILCRQALNVEGGAITANTWHVQPLTFVAQDDMESVIRLNTVTGGVIVRQGKYRIRAMATLTQCEAAIVRVLDVGRGVEVANHGGFSGTGGRLDTYTGLMEDVFTLVRDSELQLQQLGSSGNGAGWARGMSSGADTYEHHGFVELWRMLDR